jgi:hypothetical protein
LLVDHRIQRDQGVNRQLLMARQRNRPRWQEGGLKII